MGILAIQKAYKKCLLINLFMGKILLLEMTKFRICFGGKKLLPFHVQNYENDNSSRFSGIQRWELWVKSGKFGEFQCALLDISSANSRVVVFGMQTQTDRQGSAKDHVAKMFMKKRKNSLPGSSRFHLFFHLLMRDKVPLCQRRAASSFDLVSLVE